jgi:hypothetical protein
MFRTFGFVAVSSLAIALLPGGIFAALNSSGAINWKMPAHGERPEKSLSSIRLMLACWAGSFAGVILAIVSMFLALEWDIFVYPNRVRDGQGGFVIIFSGPLCGLLGSVLVIVGYRFFLCSSLERLWSAPWLYSGNRRIANMSFATAIFVVMWGCLFSFGFLTNWALVHPGPF